MSRNLERIVGESRVLRTIVSGQALSVAGSQVTEFVLPTIAVIVLGVSAFQAASLRSAQSLTALLSALVAGWVVDRYDSRSVMLVVNVVGAVAAAGVALLALADALSYGSLVALACLLAALVLTFETAMGAYLVGSPHVPDAIRASAAIQMPTSVGQMAGPALGAALLAVVAAPLVMLLDALSYLLSLVVVARVPPLRAKAADVRMSIREMLSGVIVLWSVSFQKRLLVAAVHANFATSGIFALYPFYLLQVLRYPAWSFGGLAVAAGAGGIAASLVAGRLVRRLGSTRAVVSGLLLSGVGGMCVPLLSLVDDRGTGIAVLYASNIVWVFGVVTSAITIRAVRMQTAPPRLVGRVLSGARLVTEGAEPLGAVIAGALAALVGVVPALAVLGGYLALSALWLLLPRPVSIPTAVISKEGT